MGKRVFTAYVIDIFDLLWLVPVTAFTHVLCLAFAPHLLDALSLIVKLFVGYHAITLVYMMVVPFITEDEWIDLDTYNGTDNTMRHIWVYKNEDFFESGR